MKSDNEESTTNKLLPSFRAGSTDYKAPGRATTREVREAMKRLKRLSPIADTFTEFIYLIDSGIGLFKIGCTVDIEKRLVMLQVGSPVALTLLHLVGVKDCANAERKLHHLFEDKRHHGEWFKLSENDVKFIMKLNGDNFEYEMNR